MKFRTEIDLKKEFLLDPQSRILALGSCFADRVGQRFADKGMDALVNPFGVVYNPLSLHDIILCSLNGEGVLGEWEEQQSHLVNTMYHGEFSSSSQEEGFKKAIVAHQSTKDYLENSSILIVTWGTAYAYEDVNTGQVVCNCHRFPAARFRRRLLGVDEIVRSWADLLQRCFAENPNLKVVLTVSPVRHIRDSLVKNTVSKSVLHLAVHKLMDKFDKLHYFPSYEIMMDDLRDYRFYEENLVQPNDQAVTYIVSKFSQQSFSSELVDYWNEAEEIVKLLSHKIMTEGAEADKFIEKRNQKLSSFRKKYPFSKLGLN